MDVFMRNIDYTLTKPQVVQELAAYLHNRDGPFFRLVNPDAPINFHVQLHKRQNNPIQSNKGTAVVTFPTARIGQHFLQLHGSDLPLCPLAFGFKRRIAFFSRSNKPLKNDIVEKVNLFSFKDPYAEEEEERAQAELDAGNVPMKVLQFGWLCRDYAFSVEAEEHCNDRCHVVFDKDRREIHINLRLNGGQYLVVMAYSSIKTVSVSTSVEGEHALVFELYIPPSYEKVQGRHPRLKLSFLPSPDHERVAPYASLAIRLVCVRGAGLRDFRRLCRAAQLRRLDEYEYEVVRRKLFSERAISSVHSVLEELDWAVAFQMESLLRGTAIDFLEALDLLPKVIESVELHGKETTASAICSFKNKAKVVFEGEEAEDFDIVGLFQQAIRDVRSQGNLISLRPTDGSLYQSLHIEVTPTTMYLDGPFLEQSNRVLRAYNAENHESFLRVSFLDESGYQYRFDREIDGRAFLDARVKAMLYNGLEIAGRRFEFLAYSQSAMKEHAVWFVKPFYDSLHGNALINAQSIIASLGQFEDLDFDPGLIYCPARYGARISQAFTATDAVKVEIEELEIFRDEDIATPDNKYQFTDGVGKLSRELSHGMWSQLRRSKRKRLQKTPPSAYQIRFQGSKGMVSIDHTLRGSVICLRPSMIKFQAPEETFDIEIARAFDRPGPYFLNRPLIMLLEGLGVPSKVFEDYQKMAVETTRKAARSLKNAATLMESYGLGTAFKLPSILKNLGKLDIISLPENKFYVDMLQFAINHVLRDLKYHARIPIPGAWTLVGVADTHRYLQPNQIFACIKPIDGGKRYLRGRVLISRSPVIHPGDVQIVEAIGAPPRNSCFAVEALPNTVVFSVQGDRPVPSCLGGGDLDGDLYNLIPLDDPDYPDLQKFEPRGRGIQTPASYEPAEKKKVPHPSTMRDVADFFVEYIISDVVGIVATNWLLISDKSPQGIFDGNCITLAQLHSNAVDYPKSGQPVKLDAIPRVTRDKPDYMAPETANIDDYYKSQRALGHLFRAIDLPIEQQPSLQRGGRRRRRGRNTDELVDGLNRLNVEDAWESNLYRAVEEWVQDFIDADQDVDEEDSASITQLFQRYASELKLICASNTLSRTDKPLLEEEAIIGTIAQKTSQRHKRKDAISKLREGTDLLVRGIREELAGDDSVEPEESLTRAWMAWELAVSEGTSFGAQSFGWIALGAIFEAIKEINEE